LTPRNRKLTSLCRVDGKQPLDTRRDLVLPIIWRLEIVLAVVIGFALGFVGFVEPYRYPRVTHPHEW
jgi:hypothetical protein